jgi:hypothetical protein
MWQEDLEQLKRQAFLTMLTVHTPKQHQNFPSKAAVNKD